MIQIDCLGVQDSEVGVPLAEYGSGEFVTWEKLAAAIGLVDGATLVVTVKGIYLVEPA